MRDVIITALVTSVVIVLAACGSRVCETNATQPCACEGGEEGTAHCLEDGSGWGMCRCKVVSATPAPEGTRANQAAQQTPTPTPSTPASSGAQGDPSEQAMAERIAVQLLKGWSEGRFEPLGDEFTQEMRTKLSPEAQKQGHAATAAMFGEFQSLEYVETAPVGPYRAYRFKGTFTKSQGDARPEVRVIVDDQGKVGGFWCRPWTADLAGPPPGAGAGDQGDPAEKALAERVALRFLKGWDDGRYEPLGDEFSQEMRNKFPPAVQKAGHASTATMFGRFQSLEYVEMVKIGTFKAYRFRGTFDRAQGEARPEVRVVIDNDGKVGGFFARPWSPTMM